MPRRRAPAGKRTLARQRGSALKRRLPQYEKKRDFAVTPEPAPGAVAPHAEPTFVVHKHDATRLHYDVRLEMDGALASWSVPKGPTPTAVGMMRTRSGAIPRMAAMSERSM